MIEMEEEEEEQEEEKQKQRKKEDQKKKRKTKTRSEICQTCRSLCSHYILTTTHILTMYSLNTHYVLRKNFFNNTNLSEHYTTEHQDQAQAAALVVRGPDSEERRAKKKTSVQKYWARH